MSRGGIDLNEKGAAVLLFRGDIPGEANVYGQDPVCPADGFSAVDDICPDVERYSGDRYVKPLRCAEHFRVMAFAQLTYRESLRDIEACLPKPRSFITWGSANRFGARRCRTRTKPAIGAFTPTSPGADPPSQKALCGGELGGRTH